MNLGKCWQNGEVVNKIFLSNGNTDQSSLTMDDKVIDRRQKHFHALRKMTSHIVQDLDAGQQSWQQAALEPKESTQSRLVPRKCDAPKQQTKQKQGGAVPPIHHVTFQTT